MSSRLIAQAQVPLCGIASQGLTDPPRLHERKLSGWKNVAPTTLPRYVGVSRRLSLSVFSLTIFANPW
jgi:hypothetical protein